MRRLFGVEDSFRRSLSRTPAQTYGSFLGFAFPLGAPESCRGGRVPFGGIRVLPRILEQLRKFERHHGVAGFFVEIRELSQRILA